MHLVVDDQRGTLTTPHLVESHSIVLSRGFRLLGGCRSPPATRATSVSARCAGFGRDSVASAMPLASCRTSSTVTLDSTEPSRWARASSFCAASRIVVWGENPGSDSYPVSAGPSPRTVAACATTSRSQPTRAAPALDAASRSSARSRNARTRSRSTASSSSARRGKWRCRVADPTPARRAISSSDAPAPASAITALAAATSRSRLRRASARCRPDELGFSPIGRTPSG